MNAARKCALKRTRSSAAKSVGIGYHHFLYTKPLTSHGHRRDRSCLIRGARRDDRALLVYQQRHIVANAQLEPNIVNAFRVPPYVNIEMKPGVDLIDNTASTALCRSTSRPASAPDTRLTLYRKPPNMSTLQEVSVRRETRRVHQICSGKYGWAVSISHVHLISCGTAPLWMRVSCQHCLQAVD